MPKYELTYSKTFKKSSKKLSKPDKEKVIEVVDILLDDLLLSPKYRDCASSGDYEEYR